MNYQINKVAVIGSGVMGAGIAAHIAGAGIPVCLLDVVPKVLTEQEKAKGLTLESFEVRNKFAAAGKERVTNPRNKAIYHKDLGELIQIGNLEDNLEMITDCDWIIEVIVEKLEVKKELMKNVVSYLKEGAIVTSNTSGISINKISEDMPREVRKCFMGTHFFNPPRYMKLFELIPCTETDPELFKFMEQFAVKRLGKGVVIAKDTPNFIGNRIGTYAFANAFNVAEKYGYGIAKVDRLTGSIIGRPKSAIYRTLDIVGLDVFNNVRNNFIQSVDDEEEKLEFRVPKFVIDLVNKGNLGDKTKQGFYKTIKTGETSRKLVWCPEKEEYIPLVSEKITAIEEALKETNPFKAIVFGESEESKFLWEITKNILLYSANKIPEIADDYRLIDNAMIWGYNWELGPFGMWDAIGFEESIERMKEEEETIPAWILARLNEGNLKFYNINDTELPYVTLTSAKNKVVRDNGAAALIDIGDEVLCLQFKTKGNTINDGVIEMIQEAVAEIEKNYKGMIISGENKNFSAGANLGEVGKMALDKNWKGLEDLVDRFQKANMALKYCKKPVVAAPYGMTLGGGAELAMHSHALTPHAETYMGLVELGVGLIPGGGGTKELLIRGIENLKNPTMAELINQVKNVWKTIAMGKVSGSAHEAVSSGFIRKTDKIIMNRDYIIADAKRTVLYMHDNGFTPLQKKPILVLGTKGRAAIQYELNAMKNGNFVSEYDAYLADKLAYVLTGGDVPAGVLVSEEQILQIEKEIFVSLCGEEKTLERIEYMLRKGKPLRN